MSFHAEPFQVFCGPINHHRQLLLFSAQNEHRVTPFTAEEFARGFYPQLVLLCVLVNDLPAAYISSFVRCGQDDDLEVGLKLLSLLLVKQVLEFIKERF